MRITRPVTRLTTLGRRGGRARGLAVLATVGAIAAIAVPAGAFDFGRDHHNVYKRINLISDIDGVARITDPNLVNPWGMAAGPTTPLWINDNGKDVSTLYTGGVHGSIPQILSLVVSIPGGAPTGIVFNPTHGFDLTPGDPNTAATFIFDSEAGQITAWSRGVGGTDATSKFTDANAEYKGLAIASNSSGTFLYAANFKENRVDVFNDTFAPVTIPGAFTDPNIPSDFAPFGIQELGGRIYVSYAKQGAGGDDEAGPGNGFVDVFDTRGHLLKHLIEHGALNSPWGMTFAPPRFGAFGGDLLVGNFGDGAIHAYDPRTGAERGALMNRDGNPILINGLWGLRFGNGVTGTPDTLLFTAGIGDEDHGLFGEIVAHGEHH